MKESMDRRGFFTRAGMLLASAAAATLGIRIRTEATAGSLKPVKTSRKRADHWRELAG